jgi:diguanylate cyclase (GGDEF)-like protein
MAGDGLERQFRVLFISSYGYSNYSVSDELSGFEAGIGDFNVDISYEFMDAGRFFNSTDTANFNSYLRYKIYTSKSYDIVVVADDPALRYAINNRSKLFPDIPMVFMGINNKTEAVTASAMKNATGIAESPDFEGNYELIKKLFPNRQNLVVVVDASVTGQGDYVEFMKFKENHSELSSTVINTSYYTAKGLKEVLGSLGNNDVILFLDFSADGENNAYSLQNASSFLSEYASEVPIFRVTSADVGYGVLGGISYSYYDAGLMAGKMVRRILGGESADDMSLVLDAVTCPYFEQMSMDKFGITYLDLPEGAEIFNEHNNFAKFYRENTAIANLTIVVVLLMIFIIVMLNISNIHRKRLIRTDFLTGLINRMGMMELLRQAKESDTAFGFIMLDVDHFKNINDTYGHKVGDDVIKGMGKRLKELARKDITFARLGGDEFCGIFTSPSREKAEKICSDIIESAKKEFETSRGNLKLTVSVGCAMYPVDTMDKDMVMERADEALYVTKEGGRNGYSIYGDIKKK